jgi:arylsulfatase A-like enzyme
LGEREHPQIATPDNVSPPPYYPDHPIVRQEWARFLNSVSGMDRRIGLVLDRLKADDLADTTIVFFFADNGRLEPRGIHWCYDSGLHVPLIIHWPKNVPPPPQYAAGQVNEQVLSLLDITATTLAMGGVERHGHVHGRNLFGEHAGQPRTYAFSARDRIDETVQRIRTVRDAQYRYIKNFTTGPTFASLNRYKEKCFPIIPLMRQLHSQGQLTAAPAAIMDLRGPSEELYDVAADPYEIHNLIASPDPRHQQALTRLRAALDVWIVETGDRGDRPEASEIVTRAAREMHDWFGTPPWAENK